MTPEDWHPQDWIIVIEALHEWSTAPPGEQSSRQIRAEELMLEIGEQQGVHSRDLVEQADEEWYGRVPWKEI